MNDTFQNLMRDATRLTRSGQLSEATQAIQRALQGASAGPAYETRTSPGAAASMAHLPGQPPIILDGCVFEVAQPDSMRPEVERPQAAVPEPSFNSTNASNAAGEFSEGSHTHAALTRRYKLYTPPGSVGSADNEGKSLPLVVMLHGCTQNPDDFAAGTGMNALAREQGFCVLYPAQSADANPQRCWNWFKHNHQSRGRGEAALLASMTLAVIQQHGIDARRVYIAGLSAGGAMAANVAAAYPEIYAAVGVHSGLAVGAAGNVTEALAAMRSGAKRAGVGGTRGHVGGGVSRGTSGLNGHNQASPGCAVPSIVFHGDQDATVHPRNGEQASEQAVAAAQGASGQSLTQRKEQGVASGGRRFTRTVHQRSNDIDRDLNRDGDRDLVGDRAGGTDKGSHHTRYATVAEHWLVHGGGHAWSGGDVKGSYTDPKGPDASREMLRFFLAHPMPLQQPI